MEKSHHKQKVFCYKRPAYRESRWERAVKVYTINQESKYLLVQGVPTVGASRELIERFALYGDIEEYRLLDEYPCEEFTEVYWVKYKRLASAKFGKKKMDNAGFFGGLLHVCYAPEYESIEDTRQKIVERRKKCRNYHKDDKPIQNDISNETGSDEARQSIIEKRKKCWQYKDTIKEHFNTPKIQNASSSLNSRDQAFKTISSPCSIETPAPPPLTSQNMVSIDKSLPRVATKNATLPAELQNLQASEVNSAYYSKMTGRSAFSSKDTLVHDKQVNSAYYSEMTGRSAFSSKDTLVYDKQTAAEPKQCNTHVSSSDNTKRKKVINWLKRTHGQSDASSSNPTPSMNTYVVNKNYTLPPKGSPSVYQYCEAPGPKNPFKSHVVERPVATEQDSFESTVQFIQEKLSKTSEVPQRESSVSGDCPLQSSSETSRLMVPNVIMKKKRCDGRKRI